VTCYLTSQSHRRQRDYGLFKCGEKKASGKKKGRGMITWTTRKTKGRWSGKGWFDRSTKLFLGKGREKEEKTGGIDCRRVE